MLRAVLVLATIALVTIVLIPFQWLSVRLKLPTRRTIPVFYHGLVHSLLGVRIHVTGNRLREHPLLIISNHVSWLDISVITALAPVVFVAKREIASWPVFGLLAKLQRSVFVDRTRRQKTQEVNAEIAQRLAAGDPVVLFGEGTSSDGNRVLPFRTALIGAARDAMADAEKTQRVWIQPLSIAYTRLLGLPLGRQHRPLVAWYGGSPLWPHLLGISQRGGIDVVVTWGEPIAFDETSDRKAIAKILESTIRRLTTQALRSPPPARPSYPAPAAGRPILAFASRFLRPHGSPRGTVR
jgi:lyso-ornithine lipid O-acyltransferase